MEMKTKQYIDEIIAYEDKLSEENREKFDIILFKIRFAHMDEHDGAEFLYHCMDLFLEAEKNEIPPEEMLGTYNLERFCEDYIRESRKDYSFFKRIYWEISYIPLVLFVYLGIFEMGPELLQYWAEYGFSWKVRVNTGMIINTLMVLMVVNILLFKAQIIYMKLNSTDKTENRKCIFALWLLFTFFVILFVLVKSFMSVYMFQMNYFLFIGVLLFICILQHILENKETEGTGYGD